MKKEDHYKFLLWYIKNVWNNLLSNRETILHRAKEYYKNDKERLSKKESKK